MKKIIFYISILMLFLSAFANTLEKYYKFFPIDAQELYFNTIFAVNSNAKYKISELNSKNGSILFSYNSKNYLITLTRRYQNQTMVKISAQDSQNEGLEEICANVFNLINLQLKISKEVI